MIEIRNAVSEVTGKVEPATICPELRSECDGKQICEGIADVDLLAMHDLAVVDGRVMPAPLAENGRKIRPFMQGIILRAWSKERRADLKKQDREEALKRNEERIRADEAKWQTRLTDEELPDFIQEEPDFVIGLAKLMAKLA